jgi:hypothetical protein
MSSEDLDYHLRELRADVDLVSSRLRGEDSRASRIQALALIEHDLEVHVPQALALLSRSGSTPAHSPSDGEPTDRPGAAVEAARRLAAAAEALAGGGSGLPVAGRELAAARDLLRAAR